jgi:hypothetical protein
MTTIQAAGACPERDHAKMNGRFPGAITGRYRPSRYAAGNAAGLTVDRANTHEDRGRAGQGARDVEEEAEARGDPVRAAVEEERETDDEDHQRCEPDARVDEDVLERRDEAEVVVRPHEVVEPDEAPADVGESQVERVDRRRDAEGDQEGQIRQDERQPT